MDVHGTYAFDAPAQRVWDLLMDPHAIADCLPGCESLDPAGADRYRARLRVAVAAITGQYEGTVTIADKQPPVSYRLIVEGSGRAGFVNGDVTMRLREEGTRTTVDVSGSAQVGGTIAQVGQRLLGGVSRMLMDRFFGCLRGKAEGR